jgi:hypothetical protein
MFDNVNNHGAMADPLSCTSDSFYFNIKDWDNQEEVLDTLTSNIRQRLNRIIYAPGWEQVHAVVADSAIRPFVTREYGVEPFNAKVAYQLCWEYTETN